MVIKRLHQHELGMENYNGKIVGPDTLATRLDPPLELLL